jgi:hypothetical protein
MKSPLNFLAATFAACFITVAAFAADASPTGTWKWTQAGRGGVPGVERSMKLELKEGRLSGKLLAWKMGDTEVPDVSITDASFKDGVVAFSISREFNGNTMVLKYSAKLEGDKLTGSIAFPDRDGAVQKIELNATRAK